MNIFFRQMEFDEFLWDLLLELTPCDFDVLYIFDRMQEVHMQTQKTHL